MFFSRGSRGNLMDLSGELGNMPNSRDFTSKRLCFFHWKMNENAVVFEGARVVLQKFQLKSHAL